MNPPDSGIPATHEPQFSWQRTANGRVFIFWQGQLVTVLKGRAARAFLARVDHLDEPALQGLLARVTGNFKRGNERQTDPKPPRP